MLIRDVLLHKRCGLEQFLASLATKLAFILLFYVWFGSLR